MANTNPQRKVVDLRRAVEAMKGRVQGKLNDAARDAAFQIDGELNSGSRGIQTETGSAAASIYTIRTVGGQVKSEYAASVLAMSDAYLDKYSPEHLQERLLPPHELQVSGSELKSAVASCSKVMAWWELGHQNRLTGLKERVPFFRPMTLRFAVGENNIVRRMNGILDKGR